MRRKGRRGGGLGVKRGLVFGLRIFFRRWEHGGLDGMHTKNEF
jgi:hypothetical protein